MKPDTDSLPNNFRENDTVAHTADTSMSRRHALGRLAMMGSAMTCATTLFLPSQLFASSNRIKSSQSLDFEDWKALVGNQFMVTNWKHSINKLPLPIVKLTLEEVYEHSWVAQKDPFRPAGLRAAPISLFFSANLDFPSATYNLESTKMQRRPLFFHPARYKDDGNRKMFEVVLN